MLDRETDTQAVASTGQAAQAGALNQPAGLPDGVLQGKVTVVAGGTGNVGRYLVSSLLGAGATVIVPSRSAEKLEAFMEGHRKHAGRPHADDRLRPLVGNIADEVEGPQLVDRILEEEGRLDGAVASLGRFVPTRSILSAEPAELSAAVDGYLMAHFGAARAILPALRDSGGSYTFIQGPLAFDIWSSEASLVSVATSAQAMLARAIMAEEAEQQTAGRPSVRVNELVMYAAVGWGDEKRGPLEPEHIGAFVARLMSDEAEDAHGMSIHLKTPSQLDAPWSQL
jgi:NAD(P)-dependent dehydrogenase (short-subunit alcohol dehydrogenase family)